MTIQKGIMYKRSSSVPNADTHTLGFQFKHFDMKYYSQTIKGLKVWPVSKETQRPPNRTRGLHVWSFRKRPRLHNILVFHDRELVVITLEGIPNTGLQNTSIQLTSSKITDYTFKKKVAGEPMCARYI